MDNYIEGILLKAEPKKGLRIDNQYYIIPIMKASFPESLQVTIQRLGQYQITRRIPNQKYKYGYEVRCFNVHKARH
jgi:hypothetical protein